VVAHVLLKTVGYGTCKSSIRNLANVIETDHLDNNIMHTPNHEIHIVMARSPEAICRCDGRMGCSLEARRGPISSAGMPESWKDKAGSLGVSRLLDGD